MSSDEHLITFAHISDTHLHADPNFTGGRGNPLSRESALRVIEAINASEAPISLVLHTGDVGHKIGKKPQTYSRAREILGKLHYPVLSIPGNHDRVRTFQQAILGRQKDEIMPHADQDVAFNGVQFLLLDSHAEAETGVASGYLSGEQLQWIIAHASRDDPRPLVVAVHHHPVPMGAQWLDKMKLTNGDQLHEILRGVRTRLRGVFFGHIHETSVTVRDGIAYYSAPSTHFQTNTWPTQLAPQRDAVQMPGYNLVTLTEHQTHVRIVRVRT